MKSDAFINASMLKELGYSFTDPDDESLFLEFVNELFAEKVGRKLVGQLPPISIAMLRSRNELDADEVLRLLHQNHIETGEQIELAWKELREELLARRKEMT